MCGARLCFVSQTLPNFIHCRSRWGTWQSRCKNHEVDSVALTLRVWQTSVHQATFCSATGHLKLSNIREVERTRQAPDCKHYHRLGELEVAVTSSSNGWRRNDTCLWGSGFSASSNVTVWGATGGRCIVAFKKKSLRYGSRRASATCTRGAEAPLAPRRGMNTLQVLTECLNRD